MGQRGWSVNSSKKMMPIHRKTCSGTREIVKHAVLDCLSAIVIGRLVVAKRLQFIISCHSPKAISLCFLTNVYLSYSTSQSFLTLPTMTVSLKAMRKISRIWAPINTNLLFLLVLSIALIFILQPYLNWGLTVPKNRMLQSPQTDYGLCKKALTHTQLCPIAKDEHCRLGHSTVIGATVWWLKPEDLQGKGFSEAVLAYTKSVVLKAIAISVPVHHRRKCYKLESFGPLAPAVPVNALIRKLLTFYYTGNFCGIAVQGYNTWWSLK